jgi:hypothetical protein
MAFSQKTLLIVGAGASVEIGFPTGPLLKDEIRASTNVKFNGIELEGDREFCRILEDYVRPQGGNLDPILKACAHIHRNVLLSGSIDQFLSSHQADEAVMACAKLAIAYRIALSERASHLNDNTSRPNNCDFVYLKDSWLPRLWARLQNGQPIQNWQEFFRNFRVISFNYDRCLEQFLALAISGFCRVQLSEARRLVETLPIIHVYGSLGSLDHGASYCAFAPDKNAIQAAATRILTFSETVKDNIKQQISEHLSWSDRIVVLGFSYANVNMDLFPRLKNSSHSVVGTSLGMSEHNRQVAKQQLNYKLDNGLDRTILSPVSCAQLFDDFDLSLS